MGNSNTRKIRRTLYHIVIKDELLRYKLHHIKDALTEKKIQGMKLWDRMLMCDKVKIDE